MAKSVQNLYVINTWFMFEGKIPNDYNVIVFTKNHTDDNADGDRTKKKLTPPVAHKTVT